MRVTSSNFHCTSSNHHDLHLPISVVMTDPHYHHHQGGKGHNSTIFTTSSELQVATTCRGRNNGDKNRRHVHFEDEELDEMEDENEKKTKMMNKKKIVPLTIKVSKQQPPVVPFWEVGNRRLVPNRSINQDTLNFRRLFSSPSSSSQTHNNYNEDGIHNEEKLRDDDSSSHPLTQ